ncbi:MAG: hypothetical protein ABIR92_07750 [Gemmatimonadaceae bacterium]
MRRLILLLGLITPVADAEAQSGSSRDVVPREMQRSVEERWNGRNELRSRDSVFIARDSRPVEGNVAVQNGPLVIGGRINGNVLAVNSDVTLRPGARIDGDLWIVGGQLRGRQNAAIAGDLRVYERRVNARRDGESLFIEADEEYEPRRSMRRRAPRLGGARSWSDPIHLASAGAYNRVEGLPINIGPSIYQRTGNGSFSLDAFAVVRTGSTFGSAGDVGHDINSEIRFGQRTGPAIGGRLFNVIDPVESWQLSEIETSLAAFLFRRDYRDYFENRGLSGYGRFYVGRDASLTGTFSDQRWGSRDLFNPFTLFRADANWRPNPTMDVGRLHIGNVTLKYDTRTKPDQPQSGFFVLVDAERGVGRLTSPPPTVDPLDPFTPPPVERGVEYTRGFVDLRSYNRLSPSGQISFRVVGGGWVGGDALPMQRRLSVEGSSVLPGFDFRDNSGGAFHRGTCSDNASQGRPATCDRIALAQVEYRGDIHLDLGDWREDAGRYIGARSEATWVMFFDAGRGWMVGDPTVGAEHANYSRDELPPLNTFRSDYGLGFDFGGIGVYAAKSISKPSEPINVFLRLHRRF